MSTQHLKIKVIDVRIVFTVALMLGLIGVVNTAPLYQVGRSVEVGGFATPESVAVGPDGRYYVSNVGRRRDILFSNLGKGNGSIKVISGDPFAGTATVSDVATGLNNPSGVVFIGTELFVVDEELVWKIETVGEGAGEKSVFLPPESFPGGTRLLNDIAADAEGNLFISDSSRDVIFQADPQGTVSILLDKGPMNPLRLPNGLIIDTEGQISGQSGRLLVVDLRTGVLVAVTPDGTSAEVIARGFGTSDGSAFDAQGNLYVSDIFHSRVFRMAPDRSVEVFARVNLPADLTVDKERGWLVVPNIERNRVTFIELP